MGMNVPPADHGSDRFGHVEASWRTAPPPPATVQEALAITCPDCNVNVFVEEAERDGTYQFTVAHDETCPWLSANEDAV